MLADLAVQLSPQSQKEAMLPKQPSVGNTDAHGEIVSFGAKLGEAMGSDKRLTRGEVGQGKEKAKVTDDSTDHQEDEKTSQTRIRSSNTLAYLEQVFSLGPMGQLANMVDSAISLDGKRRQGEELLETVGVLEALETKEVRTEQMDSVRTWFKGAAEEVSGEVEHPLDTETALAQGNTISLSGPLVDLELAVSQAALTTETRSGRDRVLRETLAIDDGDVAATHVEGRVITDVALSGDPMADSATSSVPEQDGLLAFMQEGHRMPQTEIGDGTAYQSNSKNWLGSSALLRPRVSSAPRDPSMRKVGAPTSGTHADRTIRDLVDMAGRAADDGDLLSTLLGQDPLQEDSVVLAVDQSGQISEAGFGAYEGLGFNEVTMEQQVLLYEALTDAMASGSPLPWDGTAVSRFASSQYGVKGALGNFSLGVAAHDLAILYPDDLEPGSQDGTGGEISLWGVRQADPLRPDVTSEGNLGVATQESAVLADPVNQEAGLGEVAGIQAKNEKQKPVGNGWETGQGMSSSAFRHIRVSVAPQGEQDNTHGEAHTFGNGPDMAPTNMGASSEAAKPMQHQAVELEQSEGTPERTKDATIDTKEVTRPETLLTTSLDQSPVVDETGSPHPSPSAPVSVRQVVDQIVHKVELEVKGEYGEVRLQLKPEHLGELEIKIATNNGVVSAAFLAESKTVKGLIEAGLPQLKQQLMQQGLNIQDVSVEVGGGNSHGNQSYTGNADSSLSGGWYQGSSGRDTVGAGARTRQSLWGGTIDYRA